MAKPRADIAAKPNQIIGSVEAAEQLGISKQRFHQLCFQYNIKPWFKHHRFSLFLKSDIKQLENRKDMRYKENL